jgi:hypothetical protein
MNQTNTEDQTFLDLYSEAEKLFSDLAATSTTSFGITREAYGEGEQAA